MEEFTPKARQTRLLRQELEGEVLIYDLDRNHAHSLNESAAGIWGLCDGHRTVSQIADVVAPDLPRDEAEAIVWDALDQFTKQNLLDVPTPVDETAAVTRRRAMLRLGLVAALVPIVESIVAPPAAWAQSGSSGPTGATGA